MEAFAQLSADVRDPFLPLWAMELIARVLLDVWLFCFGATVGSFLNVVVYRLPRGKNLAFPGSFCPHCGHPIRLSDNIPILSWLALWGRCRDCGARISPRYLAVETLVATTFLVVLAAEFYLPPLAFGAATRSDLSPYDGPPFWAMYALHLLLIMTLYAMVLIGSEGFRVPWRLFSPVLAVGLILPLIWPNVRSVPAVATLQTGWQAGLVDGIAGLVAGLLVDMIAIFILWHAHRLVPRGPTSASAANIGIKSAKAALAPLSVGAAVGVVLGWQRGLWLGPIIVFLTLLATFGLHAIRSRRAQESAPASEPVATPELNAATGAPADSETINEEVHIVSPPTEPMEPS